MDAANLTKNDHSADGQDHATRVIEAFTLCAIIAAAVFGNVSIWLIIITSRTLRTTTNMFILGLSAADLLVSIANMPLTVVAIVTGSWPLSKSACVVFGYINMLTLVTSVLSLCNISINRYFMVCRPSKFKDIYTKRNAFFMITGVVTLSLLLSAPPLFGWGEYAYIPIQSFCFCDWANHLSYAIFMICCCFGGPCSVMTVCNILIYRKVRASRLKIAVETPEPSVAENAQQKENNRKTHAEATCNDAHNPKETYTENIPVENENRDNVIYNIKFSECVEPNNDTPCSGELSHRKTESSDKAYKFSSKTSDRDTAKFQFRFKKMSLNRQTKTLPSVHIKGSHSSAVYKRLEEHRLAMSLIVVVIVFVICWLPYCISMLLSIFSKGSVPREFHMFTLVIGYANSCCNPIIYGLMNKRFAAGFKKLYCSWTTGNFRISGKPRLPKFSGMLWIMGHSYDVLR